MGILVWLGTIPGAVAQCPETIDSTGNTASQIDDFTEHTYSVPAGGVGTFADCTITRNFANPIQSLTLTIVGGRADDIGFVGGLQVTDAPPACSDVSTVVAPVNVTSQVTINGASATFVLRAQENCCCSTGWGSATQGDRPNARMHWQVTFQGHDVQLTRVGRTSIEAANQYSENSRLRATVVFPAGHPQAGRVDRNFNGMVTFTEVPGTAYYDGNNGATLLPQTVQASAGVAEIEIKSVSNSNNVTGPVDARIRADGQGLTPQASTNPLSVDQWVDENSNGFIDWLYQWTASIDRCARGQAGEVGTVAAHVGRIVQYSGTDCGATTGSVAAHTPIRISPVCRSPNAHRLNTGGELTDTVLHEARHAWQFSERGRSSGNNDDRNSATPRNDDDLDFWLEIVSLTTANSITEAAGGTGDTTPNPNAIQNGWEVDAPNFAGRFRNVCP